MKVYQDAARKFAARYEREVSEHIIHIIASVMLTRDGVLFGGSFVSAVVQNDLYTAVAYADNEVLKEIKLITLSKHNAFVDPKHTLINQPYD